MIHTKPCLAKIWNAHGKPEPMNNCDLLLVPQVGIKSVFLNSRILSLKKLV